MTKKSTATIQRRKNKSSAEFLGKVKKKHFNKALPTRSDEEIKEDEFLYKEVLGSSMLEKIMACDKTIFWGLLVIRLVNAMLIQTFFVPDEFWQSVEVAHKMVFNYGYVTWEWRAGIRSYAYPLLFATLYKVLACLGLDNRLLMVRGPRLVQGCLAAVGDLYLFLLSRRLAGREVAQWALLCQLLSWFTGYCCVRTLSNSVEAVLVTAALFYFPWPGYVQPKGYLRRFVVLAASSVVVRPTAAVVWILLCSWHLQLSRGAALVPVLRHYITAGLAVLGISTVIDRVWYGRWVLVHLNFLQFNVLSGGSGFYGRHPWHWYLGQGLPVVLGTHALPFVLGAWRAANKAPLWILLWNVFVLSFLAHKEFRFLLPVLPLAMHYCGVYFHSLTRPPPALKRKKLLKSPWQRSIKKTVSFAKAAPQRFSYRAGDSCQAIMGYKAGDSGQSTGNADCNGMSGDGENINSSSASEEAYKSDSAHSDRSDQEEESQSEAGHCGVSDFQPYPETETEVSKPSSENDYSKKETDNSRKESEGMTREEQRRARKVRVLVALLALSNLFPLLYFSLIHQRGSIDVINYLHDVIRGGRRPPGPASLSVLFLMPCHSTPYYSFLHSNVTLRFLTCEPNLNHAANYTDEAELFYNAPSAWLKREYQSASRKLPSHLVFYSVLKNSIRDFLTLGGYRHCAKFFHTHLPEGRIGSYVLVSCR